MSFTDLFKKQLPEVIEWENMSDDVLLYKFPSASNEIKDASKLVVSPGQGALLVYEGEITGILTAPAVYNLQTDNHPFITTLLKLRTNFESEHKLRIYFFRTAENVNQNWGTAQPVKYLDPIYKFPIELGANGSFSYQISNISSLFTNVTGSANLYTTEQAKQLLQSRFPQVISAVLATAGLSYQQIDAQLVALSAQLKAPLHAELESLGFALTDFRLNGTLFDAGTIKRINSIADMTAENMAAGEGGLTFTELEKLKALRDAARNTGGMAGAAMQFGAGAELGKAFTIGTDSKSTSGLSDIVEKMQQLKLLMDKGIITPEEFEAKKKTWLENF